MIGMFSPAGGSRGQRDEKLRTQKMAALFKIWFKLCSQAQVTGHRIKEKEHFSRCYCTKQLPVGGQQDVICNVCVMLVWRWRVMPSDSAATGTGVKNGTRVTG